MMDLWATVPYYTAYLSRALIRWGVPVTVGSITYYLDRDCFRGRGLRLQPGCMDVVGKFSLPQRPRRALKLAEALLNMAALTVRFAFRPPDVVHIQYLPMLRWRVPLELWFLKFCRARGAKLVLTVHDLLPHDTADAYRAVFRDLYHRVDALICHSEVIRKRLQEEFGIAPDKVSVIPHGPFFYDLGGTSAAAMPSIAAPPGKQIEVLWQGIIFPYKGLDLLLDAWQGVEAADAGARLRVVGTGAPEMLASLREQATRLGLRNVAFDLRFVSSEELVAAYRAAEIVVYPYRAITTSGALATGLALGKTILASDLPVFRELLTDGGNARLVPPGDAPALAAAIVELIRDAGLRTRLADNVKTMDFGDRSWLDIAARTAALYRSLCMPPSDALAGERDG